MTIEEFDAICTETPSWVDDEDLRGYKEPRNLRNEPLPLWAKDDESGLTYKWNGYTRLYETRGINEDGTRPPVPVKPISNELVGL